MTTPGGCSPILDWVHAQVDAITGESPLAGFERCAYQNELVKEPDGAGFDGKYFVDLLEVLPDGPAFGDGYRQRGVVVAVQVGYLRPGGDLGEGDRLSVERNAGDDMLRIRDRMENAANYDGANTGISMVRARESAARAAQRKTSEVWQQKFEIQWRGEVLA